MPLPLDYCDVRCASTMLNNIALLMKLDSVAGLGVMLMRGPHEIEKYFIFNNRSIVICPKNENEKKIEEVAHCFHCYCVKIFETDSGGEIETQSIYLGQFIRDSTSCILNIFSLIAPPKFIECSAMMPVSEGQKIIARL